MITRILLCICVCLAFHSMSFAADPAGPDAAQMRALLKDGRYAEMDKQLTAIQQGYESGSISDEQLYRAFQAFYYSDVDLEPKFDQWVARFPRSYTALVARGIYYGAMGWTRRGNKYANDTSDKQFAGMHAYHGMALRDLAKSIELTAKPILSYAEAIGLGSTQDSPWKNRALLDQANRKDPRNMVGRRAYLRSIRSRWGGSPEQMAAFVAECRKAQLDPAVLQKFEASVIADRAWVMMRSGDYPGAEKAYAQALAMNPDDRDTLTQMSNVLIHEKKYAQAVAPLSKLIDMEPYNTFALSSRGAIYHRLKQPGQAFKDYSKAADLGDGFSENELGKFYWFGITVSQDKERAIKLFRSAAEKGNRDAENNLTWALKG